MSDDIDVSTSAEITAFPGASANRRKQVPLFAGWHFMRFNAGPEDGLPYKASFDYDSPTVEFNPTRTDIDTLSSPQASIHWLPGVLVQFCGEVLAHAMMPGEGHEGNLKGQGWDDFRAKIEHYTGASMRELVTSAKVQGFDGIREFMAHSLYYESGIDQAIMARKNGGSVLKSA